MTVVTATLGVAGCTSRETSSDRPPARTTTDQPEETAPTTTDQPRETGTTTTDQPEETRAATTDQPPETPSKQAPCEFVRGRTFESIEEQPGGPSPPDSDSSFTWTVQFEADTYRYLHTDIVESGTYTCRVENGVARIEGTPETGSFTYDGVYDPEENILEWDDVEYRPAEQS